MLREYRSIPQIACALLVLLACPAAARDILVSSQAEYKEAVSTAQPGDTIVLANGEWRDFEILFTGEGTANQPITLTAEEKGKVLLTGQSNLRLAGRHLVVSGLVFKDGHTPTNAVIQFRRTRGEYAYHSRVTEVVIDHFNNPERFEDDMWVAMYGRHNRFDHNHLEGKSNRGVTLAVRMDEEASRENHHRIDHNYFGPRPILGSNGGETMRIGTSHYSLSDSLTVVENNYFDRCDGEVEIISSKSGGNVFRGNLFFESRGTLTLRHGNNNLIENNVFLGNRVDHTGGIRVINKGQTIRNNYMQGLTGHRFGGGFVVMNGVPNSAINRYHQVENALIENNTMIDVDHIELAAGADEERSAPPINSVFRANLVYNADGSENIAVHDDISGIAFTDNYLNEDVELAAADNGLLYPVDPDLASVGASKDLVVLERSATGPSWYPKPGYGDRFAGGTTHAVEAGLDTLVAGVAAAGPGDVVELAAGDYLVSRTIIIDKPLTVRGNGAARIEFERRALFEIVDGGSLKLDGVTVSGDLSPDRAGNAAIRTSRYSMLNNYVLVIENSVFEDLDANHSFDVFTVAQHTFADRIEILNSTFRNITGAILVLNREIDDLGIYNAEYITIKGSTFEKIGKAVADVYRGGTDESTFGPHFEMSSSVVTAVGKDKRNKSGASIRLHGVQATDIDDNTFVDSEAILVWETVGEPVTSIRDNVFKGTEELVIDTSLRPKTSKPDPQEQGSTE
ncbi:MAG: polysaccharide lyase 6 family protein [Gammaproteobacteria bacterium]|nr:polysaccharide lyase 6 family protein [Gammaproteobacteria bacterium]NNF49968.1 alginate lyase [Woeseiaceae bacterium]